MLKKEAFTVAIHRKNGAAVHVAEADSLEGARALMDTLIRDAELLREAQSFAILDGKDRAVEQAAITQ